MSRNFLLLDLFVFGLLSAPFAEFFEFDFSLDEFAVFARPVVYVSALGAAELYELIL